MSEESVKTPDVKVSTPKPPAESEFRQKLWLAFLAAIFSFAGGAGGAYVASGFEADRWQRQIAYSANQELLRKRIELTERTVRMTAQLANAPLMKALANHAGQEARRIQESGGQTMQPLGAAVEEAVKLNQLQADLAAVLTLDALYFGRPTKEAVANLNVALASAKPWWTVDAGLFHQLLNAMEKDLIERPPQ